MGRLMPLRVRTDIAKWITAMLVWVPAQLTGFTGQNACHLSCRLDPLHSQEWLGPNHVEHLGHVSAYRGNPGFPANRGIPGESSEGTYAIRETQVFPISRGKSDLGCISAKGEVLGFPTCRHAPGVISLAPCLMDKQTWTCQRMPLQTGTQPGAPRPLWAQKWVHLEWKSLGCTGLGPRSFCPE